MLILHSSLPHIKNEEAPWLSNVFSIILALAAASVLPTFYILSGFTFRDKEYVLQDRSRKLLVPYVIWGGVIIFAINLLQYLLNQNTSFCDVLKDIGGLLYCRTTTFSICTIFRPEGISNIHLMPAGAGVLWFLTSLFTAYVLFLPLYRTKQKTAIILLYLFLTYLFSLSPFLAPWSLDMAPLCALMLFAGTEIRKSEWFFRPWSGHWVFCIIIIPVYWILYLQNGPVELFRRQYGNSLVLSPVICLVIGILGFYLYSILSVYLTKLRLHSAFAYLGEASLSLLCSHLAFYTIVRMLFTQITNSVGISATPSNLFLLEITTALAGGLMVHDALKRIRAYRKQCSPHL